ncbi:hypothetical protein HYV73_04115 [Candidatus Uhrbacteria bacterium]|nr:hypothetical protein [Candidatus Uhrbacteria bacterium]
METRRHIPGPESEVTPKYDLRRKILGEAAVSHRDIEMYAQAITNRIADEALSPEEKKSVVIKAFEKGALWNLLGQTQKKHGLIPPAAWNKMSAEEQLKHPEQLNPKDMEAYLILLRKRVAEALRGKMEASELTFLDVALNEAKKQPAALIPGKKISTRNPTAPLQKAPGILEVGITVNAAGEKQIFRDTSPMERRDLERQVSAALPLLAEALTKEPNEHLVPIESYDPHTGSMLTKHEEGFRTLADEMKLAEKKNVVGHPEKRQRAKRLLQILADAADTAEYLRRHGLVLQDLKPENLGFIETQNPDAPSMRFHDYDGLTLIPTAPEPTQTFVHVLTKDFIPPEVLAAQKNGDLFTQPILPSETAAQLGFIMRRVVDTLGVAWSREERDTLEKLAADLILYRETGQPAGTGSGQQSSAKDKLETLQQNVIHRATLAEASRKLQRLLAAQTSAAPSLLRRSRPPDRRATP